MQDPGEIAHFYDRASDLMRELLDHLADGPHRPRPFPEIEDAMGWPRRRISSVLGGAGRMRVLVFGGRRPYHFLDERSSASGRWEMWMDETQAEIVRGLRQLVTRCIYGALSRLAAERLVEIEREEVVSGRPRRYYRLTSDGRDALAHEAERLEARAALVLGGVSASRRRGHTSRTRAQ